MAEATAIEVWRAERAQRWHRAQRAYDQAAAAYERALKIYGGSASARGPRPGLALIQAFPTGATPTATEKPRRGSATKPPRLTGRQREIARLIAEGMTNRQIARDLVLTEGTVANHVRSILLRLGVRCRAQVAAWYVSGGGGLRAS
jgi:DNA-binding NarL/FixJ family response regulator